LNRRHTDYDCGFGPLLPVAPCLIEHLQLHMIALYFTPECCDPLQRTAFNHTGCCHPPVTQLGSARSL
jgi:hypothetical protein